MIHLILGVVAASAFLDENLLNDLNCTSAQFLCGNLKCVDLKLRCDDVDNCGDGSDELDCELYHCEKPRFFRCQNSKCISQSFVCNDDNDCDDFSDEKDCDNFKLTVESKCEEGHWRCTDNLCIPFDWVCNGIDECLDGSDETIGCSSKIECDGFHCKNGNCIPLEWICDGTNDCHDNSDEQTCENNAPSGQCKLDKRKYLCNNNITCIDLHLVCDGITNCPDNSDEGKLCDSSSTSCKTLKCSHSCVSLPTGPKCLCHSGYQNIDENCLDINECETFGICDQKCRNTLGSYECLCHDKYYLQSDQKTCKARGGSGVMVFSSKREIRALTLDSKSYFTVSNNLQQAVGVAYDGRHIYWTEVFSGYENIARSVEDGSNKEMIVTTGLGLPEDLDIDWLTGNVYFTDAEKKHIGVCTNNGAHCTILLNKDIRKPRGITLNVEEGDMYWTDWGVPAEIGYSLMDGSEDRPFVTNNIDWPNGLALDQPNGRLYWTDAKKMSLESIKLDGSDRRIVLEGTVKHPYAIAVFENKLYWSDWNTHTIQTCNKFNGKNHHTLVEEHNTIYGITVFHSAFQTRTDNPCKYSLCSDICLLRGTSFSCACPENKILDKNGYMCKEITPTQILIGGTQHLLMNIEHQYLGKHDISMLPDIVKHVGSLAFDTYKNILFVSDLFFKTIVTLNMNSGVSQILDVNGLGRIIGMDFDIKSNNLYICDLDRAVVEVIDLNTIARKIIIHDTSEEIPESIALVPEEGVMFVSFKNEDLGISHIDRFFMDGTGRTHVIETELVGPICLTYDYELHRIFFADATTGVIESTSVEGDDRHHFRTLNSHPVSLVSLKNDLLWINAHSKQLFWAEKRTSSAYEKKITLGINIIPEHFHLVSITRNESEPNACRINNDNCSHICLLSHKSVICVCPAGWELSTNNRTCTKRIGCSDEEFLCPHSNSCVLKSLRCNGHNDCTYGEDEVDCKPVAPCPSGLYRCANGECINETFVCNLNYDCRDKSDEHECGEKLGCRSDHFTCKNKDCVLQRFACDGINDCEDGSDEINCEDHFCTSTQFRCDSGACIPKTWECDNEYDCPDYTDEHCALEACPPNFYRCKNNKCIDSKLVCDTVDDCGDHSDEKVGKCHYHNEVPKCKIDEISCQSNTSICIPLSAECNGSSECPQNEDEINCPKCSEDDFECQSKHYRQCIPKSWLCDKVNDCGDNSDENIELCSHENQTALYTTTVAQPCTKGYRCKNGACINMTLVCNGKADCYDESDEGGLCAMSCTGVKNPCNQICISTPTGPTCECNPGYKLMGNGKTCEDDNECQLDPPICSQLCHNKEGGYFCDCYNHYLLGNDKKSCKAEGLRMSMYFVVYYNQIRELIPKSNAVAVIPTNLNIKISSIDSLVDPKVILFSSEETQAIYKLDLASQILYHIKNVGFPQKITVDWSTQNIYYYNADSSLRSISVCSFEEKCSKLIDIQAHRQVSALAVDSLNKILFFVLRSWWVIETPSFIIFKANLDGSAKTEIVRTTIGNVEDITLDINKKLLYFKDHQSETINVIKYAGGEVTRLFFNITQTEGLQFFEDHVYYFQTGGHIFSCRLYGNRRCRPQFMLHSFATGNFIINQIALRPYVENNCKYHKCPYLCVPTESGYKCLCHDGRVGNISDLCLENDEPALQHKHKFTVHSTSMKSGTTKTHSSSVAIAILIPIFLLCALAILYYYIKRKSESDLNISMRFYNPLFGKSINEQKHILEPGLHEYANPILVAENTNGERSNRITSILNTNNNN